MKTVHADMLDDSRSGAKTGFVAVPTSVVSCGEQHSEFCNAYPETFRLL